MRAFNDMRHAVPDDSRALLHSIRFADDESLIPLQVADFLAWHKRRRHDDGCDIPERPAYEILRKAKIKRVEVVWFDHKLEDMLDRITAPYRACEE